MLEYRTVQYSLSINSLTHFSGDMRDLKLSAIRRAQSLVSERGVKSEKSEKVVTRKDPKYDQEKCLLKVFLIQVFRSAKHSLN